MVDSAIVANLFTIISKTHHIWHSHPLMCFKGVRGHAPLEKCQHLRLEGLKWCFLEHTKAQISSFVGGGGDKE